MTDNELIPVLKQQFFDPLIEPENFPGLLLDYLDIVEEMNAKKEPALVQLFFPPYGVTPSLEIQGVFPEHLQALQDNHPFVGAFREMAQHAAAAFGPSINPTVVLLCGTPVGSLLRAIARFCATDDMGFNEFADLLGKEAVVQKTYDWLDMIDTRHGTLLTQFLAVCLKDAIARTRSKRLTTTATTEPELFKFFFEPANKYLLEGLRKVCFNHAFLSLDKSSEALADELVAAAVQITGDEQLQVLAPLHRYTGNQGNTQTLAWLAGSCCARALAAIASIASGQTRLHAVESEAKMLEGYTVPNVVGELIGEGNVDTMEFAQNNAVIREALNYTNQVFSLLLTCATTSDGQSSLVDFAAKNKTARAEIHGLYKNGITISILEWALIDIYVFEKS